MSNAIRADFHLHSTASDGLYTPSGVVDLAAKNGLNMIALSDHDSISGIEQAETACRACHIRLLSAVEISAGGDDEVHILGYGLTHGWDALSQWFEVLREDRTQRVHAILQKLSALGMPLSFDELGAQPGKSVGRAAIARAMRARDYVSSNTEAFEKYISPGCPAYIPRCRVPVSDAVRMLRDNGAVPVLAHPGLLRYEQARVLPLLHEWMDAGLMGIEAYHPAHLPDGMAHWDTIARAHRLLVTGGSDFHGDGDTHCNIGQMTTYWPTCDEDAQALWQAAQ